MTVIDPDRDRCREMAFRFPNAIIVNARSNDVVTMKEEGIEQCGTFLALTGSSDKYRRECMVAREHGVSKTLARIEEFQYVQEAESLDIDKIMNKKQLNAGMVMNMLLDSDVATTQCLATDKAEVSPMRRTSEPKYTAVMANANMTDCASYSHPSKEKVNPVRMEYAKNIMRVMPRFRRCRPLMKATTTPS